MQLLSIIRHKTLNFKFKASHESRQVKKGRKGQEEGARHPSRSRQVKKGRKSKEKRARHPSRSRKKDMKLKRLWITNSTTKTREHFS